ncbi:regulator of chromosome condensation 1/beta-lactamase-inhibitor protein II [Parasitella parasitica]|nr:regulator of chromosome condensation 1/beta-lactamase-inhibitor protein II [Parasitella parasitica]
MLETLPREILLYDILNLLDSTSLIKLSFVSKCFYRLANDEFIWKKLCAQEFNISQDNAFRNKGWKKFYQRLKYHAKVLTWGENADDRLGLGDKPAYNVAAQTDFMPANPRLRMPRFTQRYPAQVTVPQEVLSLANKHIIDISSGGWSFYALDISGSVYMWGTMQADISYRSSVGTTRLRLPTLLQENNQTQQKVQFHSISSGRGHAIGLARDGSVWHWSNHVMLQRVELNTDDSIVQVAANWNYSSVLTSTGKVYTVPKPDLIIPSEIENEPQATQIVTSGISTMQLLNEEDMIVQIVGLDGWTLALTQSGRVLKIATLDQDKLNNQPMECVVELTHFSSAGNEHNSRKSVMHRFLTGSFRNFAVYTKDKVMIGNVDATSDTEPTRLSELDNHDVCKVSFGDYHTGALTSQGKLLTWGNYSSGALGHGNISQEYQPIPKCVEALNDKFVFAIGFGGWQSSVLAITRVEDDDDAAAAAVVDGINLD